MTISTEEIVRLYTEEKLSIRSIASRLRINRETIKRRLKLAHVEKRTRSEVYALRPYNRPRHVNPIEAFWKKVDKNGPIQPHCTELGACWVWIGRTSRGGRGQFSYLDENGKRIKISAPKFSYQLEYGPLPESKPFAFHHCDFPPCVRPTHLFAGDARDNAHNSAVNGARAHRRKSRQG
jgi:hypothetical protein